MYSKWSVTQWTATTAESSGRNAANYSQERRKSEKKGHALSSYAVRHHGTAFTCLGHHLSRAINISFWAESEACWKVGISPSSPHSPHGLLEIIFRAKSKNLRHSDDQSGHLEAQARKKKAGRTKKRRWGETGSREDDENDKNEERYIY